ncbi:MAG: cytochrome c biogenesis protein CcsA [Planctomycetota bacterium]
MISGRPPITNLYSSWVVVSAGSVLLLMLVEKMTKMSIGNLMASAAGFLSLQYAFSLSISQGDTFSVLLAVLDTQFWLTTHVIIINLGYSATLVAGLMGMGLLFCMLFVRDFDKNSRRLLTNIIYGTVCFALLFSFFGTVLGGLWADDSWGRFWGWDPKENGALMIVLWNAVILHARWGGMVKERGIAALAVFGNIIVLWSWEGVNQLGVGLHAYGGAANTGAKGIFEKSILDLMQEPMFLMQLFVLVSLLITILALALPGKLFESAERMRVASKS